MGAVGKWQIPRRRTSLLAGVRRRRRLYDGLGFLSINRDRKVYTRNLMGGRDDVRSYYELRLNTYFQNLSDQEKAKIRQNMGEEDCYSRFVSRLLWSRPTHRYAKDGAYHNPSVIVEQWQVPKSLTITRPHNRHFKLGDFFGGLVAFVSESLRGLILSFEPYSHRFLQLKSKILSTRRVKRENFFK